MRVLFAGLGSIASRHIKNLKELYADDVQICALRSGKGKAVPEKTGKLLHRVYGGAGELEGRYDCIFITNPTAAHYGTLMELDPYGSAFFIEKPVFTAGTEDIAGFLSSGKVYYAACPLRYSRVVQYLKNHVDPAKVHAVRCICSSYLPQWRAGADYRSTYSARREMGGGVSLDLIHEWDYLTYLMGFPKSIQCLVSKKSNLEIDSDDIAVYIGEYEDKTAELHLDYFGRKPMRQMELFMEDDTLHADLYGAVITHLCSGKKTAFDEKRDDYQKRELEHFFNIVQGKEANDNDLRHACRVLRLAGGKI